MHCSAASSLGNLILLHSGLLSPHSSGAPLGRFLTQISYSEAGPDLQDLPQPSCRKRLGYSPNSNSPISLRSAEYQLDAHPLMQDLRPAPPAKSDGGQTPKCTRPPRPQRPCRDPEAGYAPYTYKGSGAQQQRQAASKPPGVALVVSPLVKLSATGRCGGRLNAMEHDSRKKANNAAGAGQDGGQATFIGEPGDVSGARLKLCHAAGCHGRVRRGRYHECWFYSDSG